MKMSSTGRMLIAGASDSADLRYASGFQPVDPVVYLETRKQAHLVVPMLEVGRAREEARGAKIWTPGELGLPPQDRRSISAWAAALARKTATRAVRVNAQFPVGPARALEQARVRVCVESSPLYPERAIKSAREVACITEAQAAAVAALRAAIRVIRAAHVNRQGELVSDKHVLTSERLKRVIDRVLLEHDCHARETIVSCGAQAAEPHHRGTGPLRAGETIVLDVFPQHQRTGYWGDITRTVVKGAARAEIQAMYRAVRNAQRWACSQIRPGVRADRLHAAVRRQLEAAGFTTETRDGVPVGFFHGTGHGVGLDIHEEPSLSTAAVRLRAGHVVTVEPGLYYPEWGGVRIEDTVLVTARGARVLCPCPYTFEL